MQFVVEATSIAHRLTILVSEKEVHSDGDHHQDHDHDDDHHHDEDEDVDGDDDHDEGDVQDDSHLLHKVVAVVLQLAQEVPSLRDEDCRKDYLDLKK